MFNIKDEYDGGFFTLKENSKDVLFPHQNDLSIKRLLAIIVLIFLQCLRITIQRRFVIADRSKFKL
jgi:hypothetical protein